VGRLLDTQQILQCAYFFAGRLPGTRILSVTRSPTPLTDALKLGGEMDVLDGQLASVDRGAHDLLLDLRAEEEASNMVLHRMYRARRDRLMQGFPRAAVLTGLHREREHFARVATAHPGSLRVFFDEKVATAWLRAAK
jgi:hypothetical protein